MLASHPFRYALALVATAGLAGCSLYAGSESSDSTGTDPVSQCVRDTIANCYLNQLPADVCADQVLTQCNLGGGGPTDPSCYDDVMQGCLASGGDPMLCDLRASESCGTGGGPTDPGDCFTRTFDECVAMSGDPAVCTDYANQICYGAPCDPTTNPMCQPCPSGDPSCGGGGDPGCFDRVFAECVQQTGDPQICVDRATMACGGTTPCDPMTDPTCGCDPQTDPSCGGSCYDQVLRDCLSQGADPVTCDQEASAACGGGCPSGDPMCQPSPPPPCDPADPMCQPRPCDPSTGMGCPTPPPPCDPSTGMGCPTPPPPCDATDPMCQPQPPAPPPPCDPSTPGCMPSPYP